MHHLTHLPVDRRPVARHRQALAGQAAGDRRRRGRAPTGSWSRSTRDPDEALSDARAAARLRDVRVDDGRGHRGPRARQGPPRRPPGAGAPRSGSLTRWRGEAPARHRRPPSRRRVVVRPAARLRGSPALPGDKSISPPGAAARAPRRGREPDRGRRRRRGRAVDGAGSSRRSGADRGADAPSAAAGWTTGSCRPGGDALAEPEASLDCGNSGTTTPPARRAPRRARPCSPSWTATRRSGGGRWPGSSEPLRAMGAAFAGRASGTLLPLAISGPRPPAADRPRRRPCPAPRSSPRSCSPALAADGETTRDRGGRDPRPHRADAPRARHRRCAETTGGGRRPHRRASTGRPGRRPSTRPSRPTRRRAAFWLVAGAIHPDAEIRLARGEHEPDPACHHRHPAAHGRRHRGARSPGPGGADGEPLADLVVRSGELRGDRPRPPPRWRRRSTRSRSWPWPPPWRPARPPSAAPGELRHKESDRVAGIAAGPHGPRRATSASTGDDIEIHGGTRLTGAATETPGRSPAGDDVRRSPASSPRATTVIDRPGSAAISYPGFFRELEGVRA